MNLACVFWFYKAPAVCENRLRIFRRFNPDVAVFGLYGGDFNSAPEFETRLAPYLNDFYVFPDARSERWKWRNGDLMISKWFSDRGSKLAWDSIFIMQWDMLVFCDLRHEFRNLQKGELFISGLRRVSEVASWWSHMRPGSEDRAEYDRFLALVESKYGFRDDPLCGLFVVVCLPREFLERYVEIAEPEVGFLEYKIPIYGQIFVGRFHRSRRYEPWWDDDPQQQHRSGLARTLNAGKEEVTLSAIEMHRLWPWGRRIFHPVFQNYPINGGARLQNFADDVWQREVKHRWWRIRRRMSRRS